MMESKKGVIVLGGFIQSLSLVRSFSELSIPVYVAHEQNCIARYSRYCNKFLKCPESDSPDLSKYLIDFAKKENVKDWLIIPTNDHLVENLSKNKNELQKHFKLLVPDQSELYNIINKRKLLEIAKGCGTNIPKTCYYDSIEKANDFRYPVLIKGNYGRSFYLQMHKKAYQVDSPQGLKEIMDTIGNSTDLQNVMIQEFIPSKATYHVVSFTCLADNGEIKSFWMGQKLRERPITNGTATFAESIRHEEILLQATPLIKALKYSGVCEIEFMYDYRDSKWELIEINPRTWKWVGLAKKCGVDYAKLLYQYAYGEKQDYPSSYATGIKWVDYFTDPIVGLMMIRAHMITLSDYLNSFKGKVIPAVWSWKDPMPSLYFPIHSVVSTARRLWGEKTSH